MKSKLTKFALSASIMLAMAFTFSCSSDDGGNDNGGGGVGNNNSGGGCPNAAAGNGTLSCDGQTYKTVVIGSQTWLAENLNYAAEGSKCYGGDEANCTTYGRLYDWNTARLACPSGWHLPSFNEWLALADFVGGKETAGKKLKSASFGGTDDKEFSALPGGTGKQDGSFSGIGRAGLWWSDTESSKASHAWYVEMGEFEGVGGGDANTPSLMSVRCVKN